MSLLMGSSTLVARMGAIGQMLMAFNAIHFKLPLTCHFGGGIRIETGINISRSAAGFGPAGRKAGRTARPHTLAKAWLGSAWLDVNGAAFQPRGT